MVGISPRDQSVGQSLTINKISNWGNSA